MMTLRPFFNVARKTLDSAIAKDEPVANAANVTKASACSSRVRNLPRESVPNNRIIDPRWTE